MYIKRYIKRYIKQYIKRYITTFPGIFVLFVDVNFLHIYIYILWAKTLQTIQKMYV